MFIVSDLSTSDHKDADDNDADPGTNLNAADIC